MRLVPLGLVLAACHDYRFAPNLEENDAAPVIAVIPDHVVFPLTEVGGSSVGTLRIENQGDAALDVTDLAVDGSSAFRIVEADVSVLLPGEQADVTVAYEPMNPEDEGLLTVFSNDAASPSVPVRLTGEGAFPELAILPRLYDFGDLAEACRREQPLVLTNVGRAELVIDTIAHQGEGFSLAAAPPLPLALAPGEATQVMLAFEALERREYTGELVVHSNEPTGTRTATQTATVAPPPLHTDEFRQPGDWEGVDVIFWVDGSGSMTDDQDNLAENFSVFTAALDDLESDWRIMAVNDSGCRYGAMITPDTADKDAAFAAAVQGGRGWEAGLAIGMAAVEQTTSGGCNEGFLRPEAKTILVLVSDEPEQSGVAWKDLVDDILVYAPSATISSIAGDLPSGCSTAAAGYGYYEATAATGGAYLSICSEDWGGSLEAIATTAAIEDPTDTFLLSALPAPETINVTVDGVPAYGWSYDDLQNAVVFVTLPAAGSEIVITYEESPTCDG
jgi:hypothetical protein